jgi:hypothetical protein
MCHSLLVHIILETDIDLSGCFEDDGQREGTWQPCTVHLTLWCLLAL